MGHLGLLLRTSAGATGLFPARSSGGPAAEAARLVSGKAALLAAASVARPACLPGSRAFLAAQSILGLPHPCGAAPQILAASRAARITG